MRRLLLAALAAALASPATAQAAAPILALAAVQPGMACEGLTVVRGVQITSFDVEVLDVIGRERASAARILVRVSGPAVDATGLGPGFSGSPILCAGADGVARNIGAISETVGEYGGRTALATPIEAILSQPAAPPAATRSSAGARSSIVGARSLAGPLTIAGVRPSLARPLVRAARKAGRVLIASPAATQASFAPPPLVPGAAASIGLTSGDIVIGAIGTIAYVDGPSVWLFGHELDAAGRRSLILQDATIHTVVNNPVGAEDLSTYKLGSPGNDRGTITSDGPSAVVGSLGAPPPSFSLRVTARDLDTGRLRGALTTVADESDVGQPTGSSPLAIVAAGAVAEAAAEVLSGAPARQSGELCMRVALRELRAPMRFCNRYVVDGMSQNALAGAAGSDAASGVAVLERYRFGALHPTSIEIGLRLRRGVQQAWLVGSDAPRIARRGHTIGLRLRLRRTGTGVRTTRVVRLRIPPDTPPGLQTVRLSGTAAESGGDPGADGDLSFLFGGPGDDDDAGPASVEELREAFTELARYDGVTASIRGAEIRVLRDPRLRITGQSSLRLLVR